MFAGWVNWKLAHCYFTFLYSNNAEFLMGKSKPFIAMMWNQPPKKVVTLVLVPNLSSLAVE